MMIQKIWILVALLSGVTAHADVSIDFDHAQGSLEFHAIGRPSALKIVGKSGPPKGSLIMSQTALDGALLLDLNGLDTGIELRNHHMKEKYLQTQTFPQAKLQLLSLGVTLQSLTPGYEVTDSPFTGKLLLHGVEKPVSGKVTIKRSENTVTATASFQIKLTDFAIDVPSFMGVTVADVVDISTTFQAPIIQTGKIISQPGNKSTGN